MSKRLVIRNVCIIWVLLNRGRRERRIRDDLLSCYFGLDSGLNFFRFIYFIDDEN